MTAIDDEMRETPEQTWQVFLDDDDGTRHDVTCHRITLHANVIVMHHDRDGIVAVWSLANIVGGSQVPPLEPAAGPLAEPTFGIPDAMAPGKKDCQSRGGIFGRKGRKTGPTQSLPRCPFPPAPPEPAERQQSLMR